MAGTPSMAQGAPAPSRLALDTSRARAVAAPLGIPSQGLSSLTGRDLPQYPTQTSPLSPQTMSPSIVTAPLSCSKATLRSSHPFSVSFLEFLVVSRGKVPFRSQFSPDFPVLLSLGTPGAPSRANAGISFSSSEPRIWEQGLPGELQGISEHSREFLSPSCAEQRELSQCGSVQPGCWE